MKHIKRIIAILLLALTVLTLFPNLTYAKIARFGETELIADCGRAEEDPKSIQLPWVPVDQIVFASGSVNIRDRCNTTTSNILGKLAKGDAIHRIGVVTKWSKVEYKGRIAYISNKYLTTSYPYSSPTFPMRYYDKTVTITVYRNPYNKVVKNSSKTTTCWYAHIEMTSSIGYKRFKTTSFEKKTKMSTAAANLGALICINADWNMQNQYNGIIKQGKVIKPTEHLVCSGVYNAKTGILECAYYNDDPCYNKNLDTLNEQGKITDNFNFLAQPPLLHNGKLTNVSYDDPHTWAARTFMGTNGKKGDIWLVVTKSADGLTWTQRGLFLKALDCTLGVPLDGGEKSAMVFLGMSLNRTPAQQSGSYECIYFK